MLPRDQNMKVEEMKNLEKWPQHGCGSDGIKRVTDDI